MPLADHPPSSEAQHAVTHLLRQSCESLTARLRGLHARGVLARLMTLVRDIPHDRRALDRKPDEHENLPFRTTLELGPGGRGSSRREILVSRCEADRQFVADVDGELVH